MKNNKKVIWLSGSLHTIPPAPNSPGVPRIIYRFAEAMSDYYEIKVISFHKEEESEIIFDCKKYIQISNKGKYKLLCFIIRKLPFRIRKRIWGMSNEKFISYYLIAGQILKNLKPDLVISTMHIDSMRFVHKFVPRSKKLFYFRSSNIQEEGDRKMAELAKYANGFISLTHEDNIVFKSFYKHIPSVVIGNFINEHIFSVDNVMKFRQEQRNLWKIKNDDFVLGYAGRLTFTKGLDHILKALILLCKEFSNVKLLIAGDSKIETKADPNFLTKFNFLVDQLPPTTIIKTGWIQNNHMLKFYSALDVALLLSQNREGHSMFGIESMCCGVPLIATKIGGNLEIVPKEITDDLILVNDEQSIQLFTKIKHFLIHRDDYMRIKDITIQHAKESFQFSKAKNNLIQFINNQL